ncbi:MAG: adenosylmethionine--8-amino-7-oxononanoate transaminase [Planctomycetes bacterium]|nr:adenosylmethionine--8-amino-7-oxononanoate transaminase [Planctomycetota bacterium]
MKATSPSDLLARDARVAWHPYTQHGLEQEFLAVVGARGSVLELADGREIVDAISSWWTCLHGHGRPELVAALRDQAARLDHVLFAGATHEPAVSLAERLLELAPPGLARVFYSDDGSTAVEVALKIALQSAWNRGERQRRVFVALEGAYHGDTFGAMSIGEREPFFGAFGDLLFDVEHAAVELGAVEAALAKLGPRAAGVVVEPLVQGAAGMRMHSNEFLRGVRAACDAARVPLIADEVMTGFGRTGALFACERAGVAPDLMCIAKGLTGGMLPLAATLASAELFEAFRSSERSKALFHGHSFTANPLGCAVALASLDLVRAHGVPARLDAIGQRIERRLASSRLGLAVRRVGGIVAFDLPGDASYGSQRSVALRRRALELGVLLRPLGNVVYALPPASTDDTQCDRIADAMAALATP